MSSHQSVDPLIGRLVDGRYRVRARIARGGMATVYVATDLRLERRIALKVMHSHLSDDSVFQSRFIQEARAAARLADPNVVNVFDQGQDGELAYLVMEYLPGITLRELLKEQRRLSITQTVTVMDAILSGLAAAHRAGIVHRDVKPENVLLAEDGRIKIGDFGLARATTANTATGQQLMGTIAYLAPELVTRGTADARSDIYALGIMMYEMLTGEQPYRGEQPMQIAFQHATESVPRPSVKNPGVPEQLDELVLWSTERDPEERPLDAEVMLERLREIERELGITPQITRTEPAISAVTAGLAIPEHMTTGGLTAVMPMETPEPVTPAPQADPSDNATKLRQVEQHGKRRGAWLVALTLILALVAGTAGWYFGTGPGSRIAVADVADTPASEALTVLRKQSFRVTERKEPNLTIAAGNAVRTDPEAGERLDRDAAVSLYISTGPAVANLKSFQGRTENDAQKVLEAEHIKISGTIRQFDDKVPSGGMIAISITPRGGGDAIDCFGGCSVHQGDTAAIVVSSGSVPAVNGKGIDEARKLLDDAGLVVADKTVADFRADPGKDRVTGVSGPDRAWREKDTVTLHVSLGPVPSVRDLSQDDARSTLSGVGLKVNGDVDEQFSDDIAKGKVIGIHDRDGGGNWRPGDTVTLIVSKGQDLVAVPDVSSMNVRQAMKALNDAGFKAAAGPLLPSEIYWNFIPAGKTDPAGGAMVKRGSTVTVLGPAA